MHGAPTWFKRPSKTLRLRAGPKRLPQQHASLQSTPASSHWNPAVSDSPARPKPVVLLILDGWGHREEPEDNALAQATLPNWQQLLATAPHTLIHTEGRHVGLPDGQMGNSEVGHMNLGAGRIVYQDLTRIDAAIEDGSFNDNAELLAACEDAKAGDHALHVFGLLSAGGVHSHESHIFAMLELARRQGVARIACMLFSMVVTRRRNRHVPVWRNCCLPVPPFPALSSPRYPGATSRWIATTAGIGLKKPIGP